MNGTSTSMVWHYAPWTSLQAIAAAGSLRGTKNKATDKAPLLWFSRNQHWEPTATKSIDTVHGVLQLTDEQHIRLLGRARFGLPTNDPRLLNFGCACLAAGIDRYGQMGIESLAKLKGADTQEWFATTAPVPLSSLKFEAWQTSLSVPRHWRQGVTPQETANHLAQVRKNGGSI